MVFLALLGLRSLWRANYRSEADAGEYRNKRRLFRQKIQEAFDVWREPSAETGTDEKPEDVL